MQKYETIFVIDSLLKAEEIEAIITKYERFISANGGEIDIVEKWGKKRLAYEIKKRQYGYYVLVRFEGPGAMIKQLEREYRLNESILRFMTLAMAKMAVKELEKQQAYVAAESDEDTKAPETSEKAKAVKAPASEKVTSEKVKEEDSETADAETTEEKTEE